MITLIAKTAVEKLKFSFDLLFSYLVPEEIALNLRIGSRVFVPFGKNDKKHCAFVIELIDINENKN
ncbi:MAG: hypothetical protein LBF97_02185, partial [Elusimicrobiota bacterium]|nr:hypothetical protein [Elusimicrobiota bacterium]